jgi:transposase
MSGLKPCPFCGGAPDEDYIEPHQHEFIPMEDFEGAYYIECSRCDFYMTDTNKETLDNKWNTRAETEAEKKIEQIRACIESYRIKKNESDPFEYGRFQEWRAIKTDIDDILEGEK